MTRLPLSQVGTFLESWLTTVLGGNLCADSSDDEQEVKKNVSNGQQSQGCLDSSDDEGVSGKGSAKVIKKTAVLSDDDSDVGFPEDLDPGVKVKKTLAANSSDEGEQSEDEEKVVKKKKVKAIVDSDDSDVGEPDVVDPQAKTNLDANSSDEEDDTESKSNGSGKKKKISRIVDSDSDNEAPNETTKPKNMFANKDLYDAESSDEDKVGY